MQIRNTVREVLQVYGLQGEIAKFLSGEGLALAANLANWAAKTICPSFYEHKQILIEAAVEACHFAWQDQDGSIVYIETSVGQVSFHVFHGENDGLPIRNGLWAEAPTQQHAKSLAVAYCRETHDGYDVHDRIVDNLLAHHVAPTWELITPSIR